MKKHAILCILLILLAWYIHKPVQIDSTLIENHESVSIEHIVPNNEEIIFKPYESGKVQATKLYDELLEKTVKDTVKEVQYDFSDINENQHIEPSVQQIKTVPVADTKIIQLVKVECTRQHADPTKILDLLYHVNPNLRNDTIRLSDGTTCVGVFRLNTALIPIFNNITGTDLDIGNVQNNIKVTIELYKTLRTVNNTLDDNTFKVYLVRTLCTRNK